LMNRFNSINKQALDFNWFLRRMIPLKKNGVKESCEELFSQIKQKLYPSWVRRTFTKDRRRKYDVLVCLKVRIRPFFEEIYEPNWFFDIITDKTFSHKVIVHENLFRMHENRKTGKIPFHAVSESLVGALFACRQADLLTTLNRNSVYEYNRIEYLLFDIFYFVIVSECFDGSWSQCSPCEIVCCRPTKFIIWVNMLPSIILSVHAVLKTVWASKWFSMRLTV
jgi:hypothetical protein